ncbi:MAG: NAD(P)-dependent glycerol-3-phosphate dehydrogenase [Rhodobacteraceae bacterium]|nr:NAD(P)-dependent glycerol-3-phosphate dehydrogenase [Paracoccaceae bacterium]
MKIAVLGAGAFGTALAVALARKHGRVGLWARDSDHAQAMRRTGENLRRLPGVAMPSGVEVSADMDDVSDADILLLAVPMQQLSHLLAAHGARFSGRNLVACAKGIELTTGLGAMQILRDRCPDAVPAILTGPSFAADIARGLPTALTLACADEAAGETMQAALSTPVLRLYRTTDTVGAELGGALKNVIAIAAGVVSGAGLGDSARAALITRGFAEMSRFAAAQGAQAETLAGLAGLGDLILTCTSTQSRNFRFGQAIGAGTGFDPSITVEGAATAKAVSTIAGSLQIDMPVANMVAALVDKKITVTDAINTLLARPLRKE